MTAILFTSKTCGSCTTVKRFLDMKGVEYTVKDREEDDNAKKMVELGGSVSTPLLYTEKGVARGADFGQISKII